MRLPVKRSRVLIIAIPLVLALLLGLVALVDRVARPPAAGPALSVHSTVDDGARGLYLWLAESGYRTSVLEYRPFEIDAGTTLLFILAPQPNLTPDHADGIVGWVERGGTLVLSTGTDNPLTTRLGVRTKDRDLALGNLVPLQPIFQGLPVRTIEAGKASTLEASRPEWVPFLGLEDGGDRAVGVMARMGRGRVFLLGTGEPFTNRGLMQADNWNLVHYFVDSVPSGSQVVFDEYHHGLTEYGTLGMRLRSEPWGWAVLYSLAIVFAYVALTGRRFGAAVAGRRTRTVRSRSEYVSTISALLRRGGHRRWLCSTYAAQLRRDLGSRYNVPTSLSVAEFVAALARLRPQAQALAEPLEKLEKGAVSSDSSVLEALRQAETLRAELLETSAGAAPRGK